MKASHNSATGERPYSFWSRLLQPFCRCQRKTLLEQYDAGVRLFDIRVRWDDSGLLRCCHGLASYDMTLDRLCREIAEQRGTDAWIMVTYEGCLEESEHPWFIANAVQPIRLYGLKVGHISVKLPRWDTIWPSVRQPTSIQNFAVLTGWKSLLPLPRLWHWLRPPRPAGSEVLSMEDFI